MFIHFKNVGQGDSTILYWQVDEELHYGIIDCNKVVGDSNPVLDQISEAINAGLTKIDFVILSHPHHDHFSGLNDLLLFLETKEITINRFIHSANFSLEFLKFALNSKGAEGELKELFKTVFRLKDKGLIEYVNNVEHTSGSFKRPLILNSDTYIQFLAPFEEDSLQYLRRIPIFNEEEDPENNSNGNLLSTVIKIQLGEFYVLLTSDVEAHSLKRIGLKHSGEVSDKLLLGQAPHHGSFRNHAIGFWKNRNYESQTPILISTGKNSYKHPSVQTVESFYKNDFNINCTGMEMAIRFNKSPQVKELSSLLDSFCDFEEAELHDRLNGDQIFQITSTGIKYIGN